MHEESIQNINTRKFSISVSVSITKESSDISESYRPSPSIAEAQPGPNAILPLGPGSVFGKDVCRPSQLSL